MTDNDKPQDDVLAAELRGVPEEFLDNGADNGDDEIGQSAEQAAADEIEALRDEAEAARQEVLYAKAEMQNLRRRMEKDIADARSYASTGFARDILSVSDNLARALSAVPEELRQDDKAKGLVAGIEATMRELDKVFGQHGVTRVAAVGLPLDPNLHQAMMEQPSDDVEPGTIIQEMQAGYMLNDRLLRPAMVVVAKKPD